MITKEKLHKLLDYYPEAGVLVWKVTRGGGCRAGQIAGSLVGDGFRIGIDGFEYQVSHIVWFYVFGKWPSDFLDHANLDVCDNRLSNLRESTRSQNNANRRVRKDSRSGIKGVRWSAKLNKWIARIKVNNCAIHLGCFISLAEAKSAYDNAAIKYFREFARAA